MTQTGGCAAKTYENYFAVDRQGAISPLRRSVLREGDPKCAIGRIPEGLMDSEASPAKTLGEYFAKVSHVLETRKFARR